MTDPLANGAFPFDIGPEKFYALPFSDATLSEIDNYIRATFLRMARESLTPTTSQADKELTMSVAMREAFKLSLYHGDVTPLLNTLDGIAMLAYQMVKERHPKETFEALRAKLYTHRASIKLVAETASMINTPPLDDSPPATGKKKPKN